MIGISRDHHHSPQTGFFSLESASPHNNLGGIFSPTRSNSINECQASLDLAAVSCMTNLDEIGKLR